MSVSPRLAAAVYLVITALSAGCGLVIEIAAGRMIAPYLGMSLYTWTAIIAVVLAGFSLGHWIGGRLAERPEPQARRAVAWALLAAGLTTGLALVLVRLLAGPVIGLGLPAVPTILVLTTLLFFAPSVFVGIPSPVLTKLAIDLDPQSMGRTLGTFYAAGAAGSILGTLAAGYLFISWLGTIGTFLLVGGLYLAMAAVLFAVRSAAEGGVGSGRSGPAVPAAIAAVAVALVAASGLRVEAFRSPCTVESDYYCLRVVDISAGIGTDARELVLDHLAHGANVRTDPLALINPYAEAFDFLARMHAGASSPFEAFFVGGGSYTVPRAWLAARPDARITVAEVDPAVTRIVKDRLWLEDDPRLTIVHADARRALQSDHGHYDVIVGDAFHDIAVPQHLVTREFAAVVSGKLKSDGIYLVNVVDHRDRPKFVLSLVRSMTGQFPLVEIWRLDTAGARTNFIVAGVRRQSPTGQVRSRFDRTRRFHRLSTQELATMTAAAAPILLTDDYAPVDRIIGVE